MAIKKTTSEVTDARTKTKDKRESGTDEELFAAAELVLKRERDRKKRKGARERRRRREREQQQLAAIERMHKSIEVIKWCIVLISSVMFLSIVIAIWTLAAVHDEVVKVQAEVEEVRPTVEKIVTQADGIADDVEKLRDALRNPMESAGRMLGKELDTKLNNLIHGNADN